MAITSNERRLILTYQATTRRVRDAVERYLRASWGSLEAYRDADIDALVRRVVPVVTGAQRQVATLTSAYLAAVASEVLGVPTRAHSPPNVTQVRGVPPEEVYRRPGVTVWTALANGKPFGAAVDEGLERLLSLGATDLQLAKTHASRAALSAGQRVVGYERVLTGRGCPLCTLASTQRYHTEDLMPIHPGCDCDVAPIYGDRDPGQVIDEGTLERLRTESEGVQVAVHEHGEYGPTLTERGQSFTSPADI